MIVFRGKIIDKSDDFYLDEVENMTIGKSYELYSTDEDSNSKSIIENVFINPNRNNMWNIQLTIKNDIDSYISISSSYFCSVEEWRDIKLNQLGL
jgi:hypothetical protein